VRTSWHAAWPEPLEDALKQDEIELMLQVNGKLRGSSSRRRRRPRPPSRPPRWPTKRRIKFMEGKPAKKVVVVPGRLVNIVV
jgi:leucyl-tRNA synthetase